MQTWGKWIGALALLAVVGLVASFSSYYAWPLAAPKTVVIVPGTGVRGTLHQLRAEGAVPPLPLIALPLLLTSDYHALKAGEYEFAAGMSPAQVLAKIIRGEVVVHKLTIPEGWNSGQLRAALMDEPLLSGELPSMIAEGSALPDTLYFSRGETRSSVLARMQKAQQALLAALWEKRAPGLPISTPEEAVILASVVEKETGLAEERPLVAGVFINRLRIGMKLQSDPTVVYGMELAHGGKPLGRALTRADLLADTPHNSYTRTGLPPTPICHPGKAALEAVLNPAATDALYFVATGTGGHRFAATLAEHERNVAAYRAALRQPTPSPAANSPN